MNLSRYIGIPYLVKGRSFAGCDCWGLVVLYYREELGIILPAYEMSFADEAEIAEIHAAISGEKASTWSRVEAPVKNDVVLMRVRGEPVHIGIYIGDGHILHTRNGASASIQRLNAPFWRQSLEGYYRHVG